MPGGQDVVGVGVGDDAVLVGAGVFVAVGVFVGPEAVAVAVGVAVGGVLPPASATSMPPRGLPSPVTKS